MANPKLPDEDNVLRYVRKNLLRRDENGNVLGILPQALKLRARESYLSVTWLERFHSDYDQGYRCSASAIRTQLTVKPEDGFSVANVGEIAQICADYDTKVRILHQPEDDNKGHSAIRQFKDDNMELLEKLTDTVFKDTRASKNIPN